MWWMVHCAMQVKKSSELWHLELLQALGMNGVMNGVSSWSTVNSLYMNTPHAPLAKVALLMALLALLMALLMTTANPKLALAGNISRQPVVFLGALCLSWHGAKATYVGLQYRSKSYCRVLVCRFKTWIFTLRLHLGLQEWYRFWGFDPAKFNSHVSMAGISTKRGSSSKYGPDMGKKRLQIKWIYIRVEHVSYLNM